MRCSLVRATLLALAVAWSAPGAHALPTVRKYPTGPWVVNDAGVYRVNAGQSIDWLVRVCNDRTFPLTAQVSDYVHSGDCLNHDHLTLECPVIQDAGGTTTACDDAGLGLVDVQGIPIPVNTCAEVVIRTRVDLLTPPGLPDGACNVAFYQTDSGTPDGSGQTSPPSGNAGCTCVEILPPLPTRLDFFLSAVPDSPPVIAADAASTFVFRLDATNLTPRAALGRAELPLPSGVDFVEIAQCPPGAACSFAAGVVRIDGIVMAEAGGFTAAVRVAPNCGSAAAPDLCARATFVPLEAPASSILSDDALLPGDQQTCLRAVSSDLRVTKRWRLVDDADGDGTASPGDRVRYLIDVWNAGDGAAHGITMLDNLPLGLDDTSVQTDGSGSFDVGRRQASWNYADVGPGSVVSAWLEATLSGGSVTPNRARLSTEVSRACSLAVVLSDDPTVAGDSDATAIGPATDADIEVAKTWTFVDRDSDGGVSAGDTVRWRIEVVNHGPGTVADARLDDPVGACLGNLIGLSIIPADGGTNGSTLRVIAVTQLGGADGLLPDERVIVIFDLPVIDPAACCNTATVTWAAGARSASSTNPGALSSAAGPSCIDEAEPSAWMIKRVELLEATANGLAEPGERLRYTISVGSSAGGVSSLVLSDEIPDGVTVDPASINAIPPSTGAGFIEPPAGLFGNGRVEARAAGLPPGGSLEVSFEARIDVDAPSTICNRAALVVAGQAGAFFSRDETSDGLTCIDIVRLDRPVLGASVTALPAVPTGCLEPGDDVAVTVEFTVSPGGAAAEDVVLDLQVPAGASIADAGGGIPGGAGVTWSLGGQAAGASGSRTAIVTLPCGPAGPADFSVSASASNADTVSAGPASVTSAVAELGGVVDWTHADTDSNGNLDLGESLTARVTVTELQGCEAAQVRVTLDVGPSLAIVTVNDGGAALGSIVEWSVPRLDASQSLAVSVDLTLSATAIDCYPIVFDGALAWTLALPGCDSPVALTLASVAGPRACVNPSAMDLLREGAVTSLTPVTPALSTLLDSAGVDDSCGGGATRIDPAQVVVAGLGALLATGVTLPGEGLPAGPGLPGQAVFYEVSDSCDDIRICRVDADADASNGRESLRVRAGTCP